MIIPILQFSCNPTNNYNKGHRKYVKFLEWQPVTSLPGVHPTITSWSQQCCSPLFLSPWHCLVVGNWVQQQKLPTWSLQRANKNTRAKYLSAQYIINRFKVHCHNINDHICQYQYQYRHHCHNHLIIIIFLSHFFPEQGFGWHTVSKKSISYSKPHMSVKKAIIQVHL